MNKHSGSENARYIAQLYGLEPDYVEAFCRYLCGIDEHFDMPIGTYSQDIRARFTLALMLALQTTGNPPTKWWCSKVEFSRQDI